MIDNQTAFEAYKQGETILPDFPGDGPGEVWCASMFQKWQTDVG